MPHTRRTWFGSRFGEWLDAYSTPILLVAFATAMVVAAKDAYEASLFGLRLWFDSVLPALMPFFALSEVLAAFGVIHFMGVLFEPLMRPLFNIPGAGGFAFAMGLVSGYPLGAIITARLVRDRLLNPTEGERLVALANTADPLFMAGVVAAGFFQRPELGATLSLAHYLAVLAVGFWGAFRDRQAPATPAIEAHSRQALLVRAATAMRRARHEDGRPFGQVLGDATRGAMASMLLVGGTIIMFSVLLRMLDRMGVTHRAGELLATGLSPLGLPATLGPALVRGLLEITNGTQAAATASAPLPMQVAVASFIIGWSGLSVHAQVAAVLQGTRIRMGTYMVARFVHGLAAAAIALVVAAWSVAPAVAIAVPWAFPPAAAGGSWYIGWRLRWAAGLLLMMAGGVVAGRAARYVLRTLAWPALSGLGLRRP